MRKSAFQRVFARQRRAVCALLLRDTANSAAWPARARACSINRWRSKEERGSLRVQTRHPIQSHGTASLQCLCYNVGRSSCSQGERVPCSRNAARRLERAGDGGVNGGPLPPANARTRGRWRKERTVEVVAPGNVPASREEHGRSDRPVSSGHRQ